MGGAWSLLTDKHVHPSPELAEGVRTMSGTQHVNPSAGPEADRYEGIRQYSLLETLLVWAAAAIPMGLLAWVVAPWLEDQLGGDEPLIEALLILLTLGLVWQFALVLILLRRELGSLRMVAGARRAVAAGTARPEERACGRKGVVVGAALRGPRCRLGAGAPASRPV